MLNRQLLPYLLMLCGLSALNPAFCAAETLSPAQQIIEKSSNEIKQTLSQPVYHNNFNKAARVVDGIVTEFVDMPTVSLLVLGKNIRQATPEQKQRFMDAFKTLLVNTYTRAFLEYKDWNITFSPYRDSSDSRKTLVKTQVHQPGQQPVNISYRMLRNKQNEWKVYDIVIDGISLVTNYRTSFNNEITRTGSLEGVIQTLVDKNKKAAANNVS